METVEFTCMEDGTREEYEFLDRMEDQFKTGLADRLIHSLRNLENGLSGYKINRLEHCLQGATRAHRAGESVEMIMSILLHDIGDDLATYSHSELAAAVLRPFVSEKLHWVVKHHGVFQMYYYAHHCGGDRNAREQFKDNPWYQDAIDFCHKYDQNCFDPEYENESLEFFEPMLREFVAKPGQLDTEHAARYGQTG